jgi:hypothetical protein
VRIPVSILAILILTPAAGTAQAQQRSDPYRWCAEYSARAGGGTNCYFVTRQQCEWAISGVGGFCRPSPHYRGPERRAPRKKRR